MRATTAYEVVHNVEESRFEIPLQSVLPVADYREQGDTWVITHVGVPPVLEGKGVGSMLVKALLEEARARGKKVKPVCPFAAAYMKRHKEWGDIMASDEG